MHRDRSQDEDGNRTCSAFHALSVNNFPRKVKTNICCDKTKAECKDYNKYDIIKPIASHGVESCSETIYSRLIMNDSKEDDPSDKRRDNAGNEHEGYY